MEICFISFCCHLLLDTFDSIIKVTHSLTKLKELKHYLECIEYITI